MSHATLTLEAVGETREAAIAWAQKALAGLIECGGNDFLTGGTTGNAGTKIEETAEQ